MNEVWVLTIKTSLPDVCPDPEDLKTTVEIYDSFEKGRNALRKAVKNYAFTKNSMFDGEGNIIYFQKYIDKAYVSEQDQGDNVYMLEKKHFQFIAEVLKKAFSGEDVAFTLPYVECDDGRIGITNEDDWISVYGADDGPINGYRPEIRTNIFSMQEDKSYYLYINDIFAQRVSSELYIDLVKAQVK